MNMVKVKTAELAGKALDWAVAIAEGWQPDRPQDGQLTRNSRYIVVGDKTVDQRYWYNPSTDWSQCGPLIEDWIEIISRQPGNKWAAVAFNNFIYYKDDSPLIAICRAVVASKLGDEVDVPKELVGVGHD